jgi:hypothetical protein
MQPLIYIYTNSSLSLKVTSKQKFNSSYAHNFIFIVPGLSRFDHICDKNCSTSRQEKGVSWPFYFLRFLNYFV